MTTFLTSMILILWFLAALFDAVASMFKMIREAKKLK